MIWRRQACQRELKSIDDVTAWLEASNEKSTRNGNLLRTVIRDAVRALGRVPQ
jgi:hypothetical protein